MDGIEGVESKPVNKVQLVAELAELAGISKAAVGRVLDGLAYVTYREAQRGFVIPGICKLDVAHRKERTCRNPRTGQMYRIAERDAVRVRAVKKAKDLITPPVEGLITPIDPPTPAVDPEVAPAGAAVDPVIPPEAAAHAPAVPARSATAEPEIGFTCNGCGAEILAPVAAAGQSATCPSCGRILAIPVPVGTAFGASTVAVSPRPSQPQTSTAPVAPSVSTPESFILFACPECRQDIEAPAAAAGTRGECPSCGIALTVPRQSAKGIARAPSPAVIAAARKSDMRSLMGQTIRIEL